VSDLPAGPSNQTENVNDMDDFKDRNDEKYVEMLDNAGSCDASGKIFNFFVIGATYIYLSIFLFK